MIDICFSDSVGCLLIEVKNIIKSDGVLPLDLHLNYGGLDCEIIEAQCSRRARSLQYFYKTFTSEEYYKEYESALKQAYKAYDKLIGFLRDGQEIRLWLSNNANDRCGLYWFCDLAKDYENKIYTVTCPGYEYNDIKDTITENRSWDAFSNPYFMAEFSNKARLLSKDEILAYVKTWDFLVLYGGGPLRILIDDSIVDVGISFFDKEILNFVSYEPKSQATIIGKMLGKWQGGCDAAFISQRIEYLIDQGKIKVVEEKLDDYGCYWPRTLSRI